VPVLPAVSVVIATRDRPELLRDTIGSIVAGSDRPSEIVVVDQSSAAQHLANSDADGCTVRYLQSTTPGLSRARNLGVRSADSPIVVFCDDDMLVAATWLRRLVEALTELGPKAVVTGQVTAGVPERDGAFRPAVRPGDEWRVYEGRLPTDVLAGGNMAIYRSAYEAIGGFDERLGLGSRYAAAEDNDLGFRLLESGFRIAFVSDALAVHRSWRPGNVHVGVQWRYGLGKGGFYAKHSSLVDRHMLRRAAVDIGRRAAAFPRRVFADRRRAVGDIFYSAGVLFGMAGWLVRERRERPAPIERAVPE